MAFPSHLIRSSCKALNNTQTLKLCQACSFVTATEHRKLNSQSLSREEIRHKRKKIFEEEKERQRSEIGRLEKIKVLYEGKPECQELLMNKCTSTPYNCAQHLGEKHVNEMVLALVDGKPWDAHRPMTADCEINILSSKDEGQRVNVVNQTLWRSFTVMLGAVLENSFKPEHEVHLHSFPPPNVRSGSFVYDVDMGSLQWNPTKMEMKMLSAQMMKLSKMTLPFEPLDVSADVAQEMFHHNPHKFSQIPHMVKTSESNTVTVYRFGDHYDMSSGPMMTHTGMLGRCTVTAVHHIDTDHGPLHRFQGVGLTTDVHLNHMAYSIIENRGMKLNPTRGPSQSSVMLS